MLVVTRGHQCVSRNPLEVEHRKVASSAVCCCGKYKSFVQIRVICTHYISSEFFINRLTEQAMSDLVESQSLLSDDNLPACVQSHPGSDT